jgi:hypothetical protein
VTPTRDVLPRLMDDLRDLAPPENPPVLGREVLPSGIAPARATHRMKQMTVPPVAVPEPRGDCERTIA